MVSARFCGSLVQTWPVLDGVIVGGAGSWVLVFVGAERGVVVFGSAVNIGALRAWA
jgi:hypothetical protein